MGKRRAAWDYDHYLRYLKEGRGQGEGAAYKPWICIQDFPSLGVCARPLGIKTGRVHHLLSRNEEFYFILLDTDPDVLDIREQFPLRLTETLRLAESLGIRHPYKGKYFDVMTTDFLITRKDGLHARTVKQTEELEKDRVREKFSIEYAYWKGKGIDWKIVTEKEINRDRARNLQWLYCGEDAQAMIPDTELYSRSRTAMLDLLAEKEFPLRTIIEILEEGLLLPAGAGMAVYKSLIRDGSITVDLEKRIDRSVATDRRPYGDI